MKLNQEGIIATIVLAILILVAIGGLLIYRVNNSDSGSSSVDSTSVPSEEEMRQEYRCDRLTADYLATDVYCNDYERYKLDFQNNSLISNTSGTGAKEAMEADNLFEPISSEDFGDFGNTQNEPPAQHPNEPKSLGLNIDIDSYQGVVYIKNDGSYRVLAGNLEDIEKGIVKLNNAYELKGLDSEIPRISLELVSPRSIKLETTNIAYWANLNEPNQIVKAINRYEQSVQ